jgi:hypothetical protein
MSRRTRRTGTSARSEQPRRAVRARSLRRPALRSRGIETTFPGPRHDSRTAEPYLTAYAIRGEPTSSLASFLPRVARGRSSPTRPRFMYMPRRWAHSAPRTTGHHRASFARHSIQCGSVRRAGTLDLGRRQRDADLPRFERALLVVPDGRWRSRRLGHRSLPSVGAHAKPALRACPTSRDPAD